jgi:hypothetical protein
MKIISLQQPWASLAALDLKHNETRSWYTKYHGPLAIHASKTLVPFHKLFVELTFDQRLFIMRKICEAYGSYDKMPTGAIIAISNLIDVVAVEKVVGQLDWLERACGDYSDGRFAWKLENTKALEKPIPAKGQLGLWEFDLEGALNHG